MKWLKYSMSFVAVATFVAVSAAGKKEANSDDKSESAPIQCTLLKRDYPHSDRSTFWLDIQCERPGLTIYATCDLRKDKQGIGRFPLQQMETGNKGNTMRFVVACLSSEFIPDSLIHVQVIDNATGKGLGGITVQLKDAKVAEPNRTRP